MSGRSPSESTPTNGPFRLLASVRELLEAVPASDRELARRLPLATGHRLSAGPLDPAVLSEPEARPTAVLVIDGVLVREIEIAGRTSAQLLGPGDYAYPWRDLPTFVSRAPQWAAGANGATVAVLDERFARASRKWPGLAAAVQQRLVEQLEAESVRTAIVSLPHAEQRILGLFWHLAERWGTVTGSGVNIQLALTHELIGRLIGARRPTVSLGLQRLAERGLVTPAEGRAWLLAHDSHCALDGDGGVLGTNPLTAVG